MDPATIRLRPECVRSARLSSNICLLIVNLIDEYQIAVSSNPGRTTLSFLCVYAYGFKSMTPDARCDRTSVWNATHAHWRL